MASDAPNWRTYSDESYNAAEYWTVGVTLKLVDISAVQGRLDEVMISAARRWGDLGLTSATELHGHALWQGRGEFRQVPVSGRIRIFEDALEAIASARPAILLKGVDRVRLAARYDEPLHAHQVTMTFLLEELHSRFAAMGPGQCTELVCDENAETAALLQRDLSRSRKYATWGNQPTKIVRVVEGIQFVPSHSDRLVQAADLVAFLNLRRRSTPTESSPRAQRIRERQWSKISGCIRDSRLWRP